MRWKDLRARCSFLLVGFLAGIAVSQLALQDPGCEGPACLGYPVVSSRPDPLVTSNGEGGDKSTSEEELQLALESSWLGGIQLAAEVASLKLLIAKLQEGAVDGDELVSGVISGMSDRELQAIMASAAHLSPEDLDEIGDIRAFATRLAKVAMEDILEPAEEVNAAPRVVFTTRPETVDPDSIARDRFESDETRIFAVFRTGQYEQDAVMMKWYRRDPAQILLFERYPIQSGEDYSYVWLNPKGGWEPGEYQVDLYAADETMTRLATGRYTVQ